MFVDLSASGVLVGSSGFKLHGGRYGEPEGVCKRLEEPAGVGVMGDSSGL